MGQCGCGDNVIRKGFKLPGGCWLGIDFYRSCNYCETPYAYRLFFFDEAGKKEWMDDAEIIEVTPDEYGSNDGHGWWLPFVGKSEIVKAMEALNLDDYDVQLMLDEGGRLLEEAMKQRPEEEQQW